MPSVTDKARSELQKEVLDLLSAQVPSDPALKTSSKLLQPGTPAQHNSAAGGDGQALVLQQHSYSGVDRTNSHNNTSPAHDGRSKHDQQHQNDSAAIVPVLPGPGPVGPKHGMAGNSASLTRAWLADVSHKPYDSRAKALLGHCRGAAKSVWRVARAHPYVAVVSLLTMAALMTAGVVGVLAAADTETRHRRDSATGFANNAATAFEVQLQQSFAPLVAMAAMIHVQPYYPTLAKRFDEIAAELIAQVPVPGAIASLQMSPQAVVRSFYPLKGNEAAMGHNLLKDPERRGAALATITNGNLTMQGPVMLKQGFRAAIARTPVFISGVDEANFFGAPDRAYNCDMCYNATTRTRFWGFVSCIVKLSDLASGKDARLVQLADMGYNYEFFAPQPDAKEPINIAQSYNKPVDPVVALVEVPNDEWTLLVAPAHGWVPSWRSPMLATVIIVSMLIGGLVLATLVSRHLQLWLLKETKASNEALAAEKTRMDVLLARQYNLIGCMAEEGASSRNGKTATSLEEKTLDRIENMRREIGVASFTSGVDQVQLHDLLGEGTYGKVFKGLWRGSTVAIKTMILPAKMSGAEKRERMAIMEAAISSTMNHPNIVQTYTYTIKRAQSAAVSKETSANGEVGSMSLSATDDADNSNSQAFRDESSSVHSFEVNLVLEYCDWGCLRDALDGGAFFADGSLNYAAILDTAADVAKAMLHLHCNQVVHSDLKVRNVLLKSDGSSERGCIAKVADFGLAVKMDHQDTHVSAFQGTMSHMAPEALLRGHISKAADVYSFGITLWELFTGCHAYHGIPRALLGHQVAVVGLRPAFPDFTPYEYRRLAEFCWQQEPEQRPTFADILATLTRLRQKLGGHTPALARYKVQPGSQAARERAQIEATVAAAQSGQAGNSSVEQRQKVAAARDAGLMHFDTLGGSYYVDSSSVGGGVPLQHRPWGNTAKHKQWQLEQLQQQQQGKPGGPDFHHFSEAGAELDALQQLYEGHGESTGGSVVAAQGQSGSQQQQASPGPSTLQGLAEDPSPPDHDALMPEQQAAQQQVQLQLQIMEQFAAQQQWMQQQQQLQQWQQHLQQQQQQPHHSHSGSYERRNRPKLETIADQPDAEAAVEQQQQQSTRRSRQR